MNKMIKFGALALAISLSAAACGSDSSDDTTTDSSDSATTVAASDTEETTATTAESTEDAEEGAEEGADDAMEEGDEETAAEAGTIVEVATEAGSFTTLLAAAEAAGLVETLNGPGPLTVFAPTDDAFAAALVDLNLTAEELLADTDQLTNILNYHVVSGQVLSTDLTDGMTAATAAGSDLTVDLTDGVKINDATVVTPDIQASNGVIHVIDSVLIPS